MTSYDILRAFSGLDDTLVEESASGAAVPRSRPHLRRCLAVAACLAAVTAAGLTVWQWNRTPLSEAHGGNPLNSSLPPDGDKAETPALTTDTADADTETNAALSTDASTTGTQESSSRKAVGTGSGTGTAAAASSDTTQTELAVLSPWETLSLPEQFGTVVYQGVQYDSCVTAVEAQWIGEPLGSATLTGYDSINEVAHTAQAELYALNTLSRECAVALRFAGDDRYYAYAATGYQPQTLGDFIDALNLKETLTFGSVWQTNAVGAPGGSLTEYTGLSGEAAWRLLLSDVQAPAVSYNQVIEDEDCAAVMSVSVSLPLLGRENVSLSVTQNGYLTTNLLDTAHAFFIGREAVQQFTDYVAAHCETRVICFDATAPTTAETGAALVTAASSAYAPR